MCAGVIPRALCARAPPLVPQVKKEEKNTFFFAFGDGAVVYNPIESRIGMTRKMFRSRAARPSRTTVTRRQFEEGELNTHAERRKLLMNSEQLALTYQPHRGSGGAAGSGDGPSQHAGGEADEEGGMDGFAIDDDDGHDDQMVDDEDA